MNLTWINATTNRITYVQNMLVPHNNQNLGKTSWLFVLAIWAVSPFVSAGEIYFKWEAKDFAIEKPLGGLKGDATRGRKLVANRDKGNCLACHAMPIKEEPFHGTFGPPLYGLANRLTPAQIRLRVVDQQAINPMTVMPSFYKDPLEVNRIAQDYIGKTMLTAQEVEDVVAYLATLKQEWQP